MPRGPRLDIARHGREVSEGDADVDAVLAERLDGARAHLGALPRTKT